MIYGLYEKIKTQRIQVGLSQSELAKKLGVTKSAVNSWESGTNSPSVTYIIKMSQIFSVSTDYLLGVSQRLTVDITDLDDQQKQAVRLIIRLFENKNIK